MSHQTRRRSSLAWPSLLALVAAGAASCSSPSGPAGGATPEVKLLVANGTCTATGCGVVHVLAFPAANQPQTPGGLWSLDLGTTSARETCLTIPASATFRIIGQTSAGTSDTITKTWTTALPLALGALPSQASRLQATPTTG